MRVRGLSKRFPAIPDCSQRRYYELDAIAVNQILNHSADSSAFSEVGSCGGLVAREEITGEDDVEDNNIQVAAGCAISGERFIGIACCPTFLVSDRRGGGVCSSTKEAVRPFVIILFRPHHCPSSKSHEEPT